jgi:hypothetical protein
MVESGRSVAVKKIFNTEDTEVHRVDLQLGRRNIRSEN